MSTRRQPPRVTVVAVVNRKRGERIVLEAADRADDLDGDLHVVYVLGLSRFGSLELSIAERVGIPVGMGIVRDRCAGIADAIAAPVADEYEPVGLVGKPTEEVDAYAREVGADCVVLDGHGSGSGSGFGLPGGTDVEEALRESDVPVVPVY